jgi:tRNA-dihydrouridine synthase B
MAGITDQPFRNLCRAQGAALAVSEMITSQTHLWTSRKSQTRLQLQGENGLRSVQIAGNEPSQMAEAARACIDAGAHIIDLNMGCPAKKVCNKAAGSALLKDEGLVRDILTAVVEASLVPVTLKIRTGWDNDSKNGVRIAELAQSLGISALTVHGRTRACRFNGHAEYDTIASIVKAVTIPVIANGDITSAEQAERVLNYTQAAAVMIGRGAQGNPWLFQQINARLNGQKAVQQPPFSEVARLLLEHLQALYAFYGDEQGVRLARKHFAWYMDKHLTTPAAIKAARCEFNLLTTSKEQLRLVRALPIEPLPLEEEAA